MSDLLKEWERMMATYPAPSHPPVDVVIERHDQRVRDLEGRLDEEEPGWRDLTSTLPRTKDPNWLEEEPEPVKAVEDTVVDPVARDRVEALEDELADLRSSHDELHRELEETQRELSYVRYDLIEELQREIDAVRSEIRSSHDELHRELEETSRTP